MRLCYCMPHLQDMQQRQQDTKRHTLDWDINGYDWRGYWYFSGNPWRSSCAIAAEFPCDFQGPPIRRSPLCYFPQAGPAGSAHHANRDFSRHSLLGKLIDIHLGSDGCFLIPPPIPWCCSLSLGWSPITSMCILGINDLGNPWYINGNWSKLGHH